MVFTFYTLRCCHGRSKIQVKFLTELKVSISCISNRNSRTENLIQLAFLDSYDESFNKIFFIVNIVLYKSFVLKFIKNFKLKNVLVLKRS